MFQRLRSRPASFYKRLWALTLPIALQNLITFSLGLIDTFMVSQLGNTEMAAVTAANGPVFLLMSMVFGIQSGLSILASQYWGKRDTENISRALGVACFLGTGLSLIFALAFALWPVPIMDLLSNSHEISVLGAPYLRLIGFSYVCNMISSVYVSAQNTVLRFIAVMVASPLVTLQLVWLAGLNGNERTMFGQFIRNYNHKQ